MKTSDHVAVINIFIKPNYIEKFKEIVSINVRNSRKEEGIISFDVIQSVDDPTEFVLIEIYKNPEAQIGHRQTEHYKAFKAAVADLQNKPYKVGSFHTIM